MPLSQLLIQKRQQEQKNLQKTLAYSLVISSILHVGLAFAVIQVSKKPQKPEKEPLELAIVEFPQANVIPEKTQEDNSQDTPTNKPLSVSTPTRTDLPSQVSSTQKQTITPQQKKPTTVSKKALPQAIKKKKIASNFRAKPIKNKQKRVFTPTNRSTSNRAKTPPIVSRNISKKTPQVSKPENISQPDLNSLLNSQPTRKNLNLNASAHNNNNRVNNNIPKSLPNSQLTRKNSNLNTSAHNNNNRVNSQEAQTVAADRSASKPTKPKAKKKVKLRCISRCLPAYPSVLNGAEGSVTVRIVVNRQGNVVGATIAKANSNPRINQQALLAARKMKFSPFQGPEEIAARLKIKFRLD